jgi:hypothetical protein
MKLFIRHQIIESPQSYRTLRTNVAIMFNSKGSHVRSRLPPTTGGLLETPQCTQRTNKGIVVKHCLWVARTVGWTNDLTIAYLL